MRESSADDWKRRVEWHKKMHAGGWVGISWPKEYGGRGADADAADHLQRGDGEG